MTVKFSICISPGRNRPLFRLTRNTDFIVTVLPNVFYPTLWTLRKASTTPITPWKLIPPRRPQRFSTFLGKITRNLAIDRWRKNTAEKRGSGEIQVLLDELAECVAGSESPETELLRKELTASLNRFLRKLPEKDRTVFLLRYYYAGTKDDIARKTGLSSNQVKYILQKVRKQLADTLKKEGLQ